MLQVLIEHRGELPPKVVGFKLLETDPMAQQIEDIVRDIARHNVERACLVRGYYCGVGRKAVERRTVTEGLVARAATSSLPPKQAASFFRGRNLCGRRCVEFSWGSPWLPKSHARPWMLTCVATITILIPSCVYLAYR